MQLMQVYVQKSTRDNIAPQVGETQGLGVHPSFYAGDFGGKPAPSCSLGWLDRVAAIGAGFEDHSDHAGLVKGLGAYGKGGNYWLGAPLGGGYRRWLGRRPHANSSTSATSGVGFQTGNDVLLYLLLEVFGCISQGIGDEFGHFVGGYYFGCFEGLNGLADRIPAPPRM